MICGERGVLPTSQYFFFSPSEQFLKYNYGVVNCGHFYCHFGYRREREGNAYPLFIYVAEGELHLEHDKQHEIAKKGEIFLIDCSKPHAYYVDKECEFYYFHFAGRAAYEITKQLILENDGCLFHILNSSMIQKQMDQTISPLFYEQPVSDVSLSCMAYQCLCILQASNDVFTTEESQEYSMLASTMAYIREHLDHKLTLEELSRQANLSPYYFAHLFKEQTGISPIEYVALTKVNYAKNILKTTENSITEISDLLGYSSDASFINAFKKRTGISPARFRREL